MLQDSPTRSIEFAKKKNREKSVFIRLFGLKNPILEGMEAYEYAFLDELGPLLGSLRQLAPLHRHEVLLLLLVR